MHPTKQILRVSVGLSVLVAAGVLAALARDQHPQSTPLPQGQPPPTQPPHDQRARTGASRQLESGQEVAVIFIGATFCNADKAPGFKQTITKMREFVSSQASARHYHLATIGVALDWTVRDGLDFVRAFGDFDEVMVGRNWLNEGAIKYIWRDVVGDPKVPQIVIVLREVKVGDRAINVGMETLLLRKMGVDEITEWVNNGAPLPRD